MAGIYKFHSILPPEQLSDLLPEKVRFHNGTEHTEDCIKTAWKGGRFTITRTTVRRYTAEDGWVPKFGLHLRWTKGRRTDWKWNNPFCGEVYSDGQGGSILTGRFRIHPVGKIIFAIFPILVAFVFWFLSPHTIEALLVAVVAAMLYLRHLIHACRAIDSYDGAEEILYFLRENFEEVEE